MYKISIIVFFLFASIPMYSQFPDSYPFETYLDVYENLYVVGELNGDIMTRKYSSNGGSEILFQIYSNPGSDKGMDIVASETGELIYVTGYTYNNATGDYNIQILKYQDNGSGGLLVWHREFGSALGDDKAYGITIDANENVYVCGYVTNFDMTTDYITLKYNSDGDMVWEKKYVMPGNQVATDILTDNSFVYVMGYTDEIPDDFGATLPTKDAMLISFSTSDPDPDPDPVVTILNLPGTTEIPTSFIISELAPFSFPPSFSKLATAGYQEKVIGRALDTNYFIAFYDRDMGGNVVGWSRDWGTANVTDIGTGITTDNSGNVVVTGYYNNEGNDDFGTLKFDKANSSIIWGPVGHDILDGQDRASSVKRLGNTYAVSGYSQYSSTNSYVTKKFTELNSQTVELWTSSFVPQYSENENWQVYTDFSTDTYILADGSVVTLTYAWNDELSVFNIVKYDSAGQQVYTIDPGSFAPGGNSPGNNENSVTEKFELKHNFPNPFNPVTMISYTIPEQSFVTLKVYDMMGREVAQLVSTTQNAGKYTKQFDAGKLASGIYIYRLTATNSSHRYEKTEKMTLIK